MGSWFSCESVLRLQPRMVDGGAMTVAEMYLEYCAPVDGGEEKECSTCARTTRHESQSRILTPPNVLVVQMKRIGGAAERGCGNSTGIARLAGDGAGWRLVSRRGEF